MINNTIRDEMYNQPTYSQNMPTLMDFIHQCNWFIAEFHEAQIFDPIDMIDTLRSFRTAFECIYLDTHEYILYNFPALEIDTLKKTKVPFTKLDKDTGDWLLCVDWDDNVPQIFSDGALLFRFYKQALMKTERVI